MWSPITRSSQTAQTLQNMRKEECRAMALWAGEFQSMGGVEMWRRMKEAWVREVVLRCCECVHCKSKTSKTLQNLHREQNTLKTHMLCILLFTTVSLYVDVILLHTLVWVARVRPGCSLRVTRGGVCVGSNLIQKPNMARGTRALTVLEDVVSSTTYLHYIGGVAL